MLSTRVGSYEKDVFVNEVHCLAHLKKLRQISLLFMSNLSTR